MRRPGALFVRWATTFRRSLRREEFLTSESLHETSCLITDLHMPGLSGIELQDRLIAQGHHLPIVFITAFPDERLRTRALEAGAICFLSKPYQR